MVSPLRLAEEPELAGCQNCGAPAESFELSRLVEVAGELDETPVVAIWHLCELCARLVIAHNWKGLTGRKEVSCQH